jgi:hypothetical protein
MSTSYKPTAAEVKELREATQAGMMDCKRALEETAGDMDAATRWLREKGIASAGKRAGRGTGEGIIESYVHDGKIGAMVGSARDRLRRSQRTFRAPPARWPCRSPPERPARRLGGRPTRVPGVRTEIFRAKARPGQAEAMLDKIADGMWKEVADDCPSQPSIRPETTARRSRRCAQGSRHPGREHPDQRFARLNQGG